MESDLVASIAAQQDTHWFFQAKRSYFKALGGGIRKDKSRTITADVGCGTGAMTGFLSKFGRVVGIDASELSLSYSSAAKVKPDLLIRGAVDRLPLKDSSVDLVCLSDVLYHENVKDDQAVINECARVLKPGGRILISDSAFNLLKSSHDSSAHAARRYTKKDIMDKLTKAGLTVERATYAYMSLFPLVFAVRFIRNRFVNNTGEKPGNDFKRAPWVLNSMAKAVFCVESWVMSILDLPVGISVMAVAKK